VTIDMGTGDGRAILAAATREPATLFLGIDASAAAMNEASRRAARTARKGGLPNARFLLAAAEALPAELAGRASLVNVMFPWGSLLRGCVGADGVVADGLGSLVATGGTLEIMLAPAERDGLAGFPTTSAELVEAVARTFEARGFEVIDAREVLPGEVAATGSTWARRLGAARTDQGTHRSNGAPARIATLIRLARRRDPSGR
jgi:16S rRNA (adenine(1408)-N(1))-methyltransferase